MKTDTAGDSADSVSGTERKGPDSQRPQRVVCAPRAIATGLTAAGILSAVVLRWFHLGKQSLWYDEGFTAWAANLSPRYIVEFTRSDTYPPLYYLLLHYWGLVFGNSEYALRALSAFFGTLSLPVFYFLAKKVLKDSMAVALAMWMFAFSMMQIWYSREARFYGLSSFLALVALYSLVLFLERRSGALFASIVLSVAASLYTHNMMFFYLFALNITWLIYPSERAWMQRVRELLLADALAIVLYLPWVPSLFAQVAFVNMNLWVPRPTVSTLIGTLTTVAGFSLDYLQAVAGRFLLLPSHTAWICVVGGVSVLCAALLAGGLWRVSKVNRNRNVSLLLYCLVPIFVVFMLSRITTPVFIQRVFIDSTVVVPIVLAYPLALRKEQKGQILYGFLGILLGATTALSGFSYLRYEEKEDWRGATRVLLRIPERNRLIVFVPTAGEILFDYYSRAFPAMDQGVEKIGLPISFHERFPPDLRKTTDAIDISALKLAVESGKYSEIDLMLRHGPVEDPNDLALSYLDRVFVRQEEQRFHGVRILRFLAPPH